MHQARKLKYKIHCCQTAKEIYQYKTVYSWWWTWWTSETCRVFLQLL